MALKDVVEMELDRSEIFDHYIYFRKAGKLLEAKLRVAPETSMDKFMEYHRKWQAAVKEAKNG